MECTRSFGVLTIQTEIKILKHSYKLLKMQPSGTQKDETFFSISVNIQEIEKPTPRKKTQGINSSAPSRNALQKEQVSYVS